MNNQVGICGVFGEGEQFFGGQPVKVKTMIKMFSDYIGEKNVHAVNTYNWKKRIIKFLREILTISKKCDTIIILPAHNGVKIFSPLFLTLRRLFHFKLVYSVIGGWLPEYTKKAPFITRLLKRFDYIFVETSWMKKELCQQGFTNIHIVNNCKSLRISTNKKTVSNTITLCFFSRVMREKGIEDAIKSVVNVNKDLGYCGFTMDIYGKIDECYKGIFEELLQRTPDYICYKGCVSPEQSVDVIEQYDLQIFPTRFSTEGIPGSIIDSYASGVPVIASRWLCFDDVVIDGVTGFGYEQGNQIELQNCLSSIYQKKELLSKMRDNCIKMYLSRYTPQSVMNTIETILD